MALPGKVVKETLGTLAEEVAGKATHARKTYDDVVTKKINKVDTDKEVTDILDTPQTEDFLSTRQTDIMHEQQRTQADYHRVSDEVKDYEAAGVTVDNNYDGRLAGLKERRRDLYIKANNKAKELQATRLLEEEINAGRSGYEGIYDALSSSVGKGRAAHNKEARAKTMYNVVNAGMTELKDKMRTKFAGFTQDLELQREVIRYLKDGQVKNNKLLADAKLVAEQWKGAANKIKGMRNKAGARIGELEDWVMPQSHNKRAMTKSGFNTWKEFTKTKLDVERIEREQGADIDSVLKSAFKNITKPQIETTTKGTSAVVKRGEESRVLHFKTGDDIVAYNKEFGNEDIFATMDNHIRSQSDEIALMQMFGGNPAQTYDKLKEIARADGMGTYEEGKLDALWRGVSGQADGDNIVSKADAVIANTGGGMRGIMVAAKLGSAAVSALGDLGNIFLSAGYRDLSSIKIFGRGLQGLLQEAVGGTTTGANLKLANRIGVVSEFANASLANSRFADSIGGGAIQKSAEGVIRASGLGSYTESMQAAFGLELAANIAENLGKPLSDVKFNKMLKEYGIDDAGWEKLRASGATHKIKGAEFFDVAKLYDIDEELAFKVSDMITNEMNAAVIMPGERTRVYTTAGTKKGTIKGEAMRSVTMFKSFPISVMMMHLNRMSTMNGLGKTAYSAKVIGTGLVMGTVTLWAYDVASGKTPRKADRWQQIPEALTKSGGLGIFGDFFIGLSETKYGHSFSDMMMGAAPAITDDIIKTIQDSFTKDPDKAIGNAYKRAASYIPGQNLWYTRALMERTIGDWVGDVVDPDHQKKKRRRKKTMRLRGQEQLFN